MKRNLKVAKIFFQYRYKPFTYSFFYKSYLTKLPSDLKKSLGRQQRRRPYSANREVVEEEKLREATTSTTAGSNSTLIKNLPQFSLGRQKQMTVELTDQESEICNLLRKVVAYLKETKQLPSVELRIAGGWVRDKLLGLECHDLDIAIDSLTGFDFANYVNEFLEKEEKEDNNQISILLI